jgi:tagatose-1,6-bisphosphate aldolase
MPATRRDFPITKDYILSAGVTFEEFARQVKIACQAWARG